MRYTAILMLVAVTAGAGVLDYETTWIDWTSQTPAVPTSKRAMDVREWGDYLLVNHGNGLVRYRFSAAGLPVAAGAARFACPARGCPVLIEADYDQFMDRLTAPEDGPYGLMFSRGGTVIWRWSGLAVAGDMLAAERRLEKLLARTDKAFSSIERDEIAELRAMLGFSDVHMIDAEFGGFSFVRGSDQYVVATGWPGICGAGTRDQRPALLRLTSTSTWDVLQCLTGSARSMPALAPLSGPPVPSGAAGWALADSGGSRIVIDGVDLNSHVYLIENWGATQSYRVTGSGSTLRLAHAGAAPRMVSRWGRSWALDGDVLLTSLPPGAPDQSGLWDVSDPSSHRLLSGLDVPYQGRVALGDGLAAVFDLGTFLAFDVRDPEAPVLIAQGEIPELPGPDPWGHRCGDTACQHHLGGTIRDGKLYLSDYGVGISLVITMPEPAAIFSDGFESGDTSRWSSVFP